MGNVAAWAWVTFALTMVVLLGLDLFVHRGGRASSEKAAVTWTVIWIAAGVAFAGVVYAATDGKTTQEYFAAYLLEKSLSLDNMFVFLLIFSSLKIPHERQHSVLAWGILGALVFRALFIFLGAAALERWDWVRYVFGGILVLAAVHALREDPEQKAQSKLVKWLSRHLPLTERTDQNRFVMHDKGKRVVTPLLVALVAIELTDVVFAVDSVPAALSVTRNRFVVYSSNAFAILGLRSLYLAITGYLQRLTYLHYGLAAILAFAAFKMIAHDAVPIHPLLSVGIIAGCIALATWFSLRRRPPGEGSDSRKHDEQAGDRQPSAART